MPIARCARGSPGTAIGHDAASIEIAAELDVEWLCPVIAGCLGPSASSKRSRLRPYAPLTGEPADTRSRWHTCGLSRQMPRNGGVIAAANPSQTPRIPCVQANSNRSPRLVSDPRIPTKTLENPRNCRNSQGRYSRGFAAARGKKERRGTAEHALRSFLRSL